MSDNPLQKKLEREILARKEAEDLLEKKSRELFTANIALSDLNKNLESLIEARTKELFESREIAVAANQAKSQFLANMSHEIRTPLNGVIGLISVLKGTPLNSTQVEYLELIEHSSELLLSIINDILEFSKIEAGKVEIETREFDLVKSIENLADIMAANAYKKGLEFPIVIDSKIPKSIISDETRIRQVLLNLTGNAIKFTPTGEVVLSVTCSPGKSNETVKCVFSVKDSGIGIPENRIKAIFEPFSQADVSDTRKYGGSGLGLTISKQIIEALGGSIKVESVEGQGSTFSFELELKSGNTQLSEAQITPNIFSGYPKACVSIANDTIAGTLIAQLDKLGLGVTRYDSLKSILSAGLSNEQAGTIVISDWLFALTLDDSEKKKISSLQEKNKIFLAVPQAQKSEVELRLKGLEATLLNKPIKIADISKKLQDSKFTIGQQDISTISVSRSNNQKNSGFKILIAEDNLVNQKVLQTMLETEGYSFEIANNGSDAVEKLKAGKFDIVFMDCQMPTMDGYDATRAIRQFDGAQKNIPIIALTANALRKTKEKCFEVGMNDFLTKPIRPNELFKMIESYKMKVLSKGA